MCAPFSFNHRGFCDAAAFQLSWRYCYFSSVQYPAFLFACSLPTARHPQNCRFLFVAVHSCCFDRAPPRSLTLRVCIRVVRAILFRYSRFGSFASNTGSLLLFCAASCSAVFEFECHTPRSARVSYWCVLIEFLMRDFEVCAVFQFVLLVWCVSNAVSQCY